MGGALDAARRGWSIFPVTPHGKTPAGPWKNTATSDPDRIIQWFTTSPAANYGIHAKASGLVVIDEDTPGELARWATDHHTELAPTFTVTTAHGAHFYYQRGSVDYGNESPFQTDGYKIDVRGHGYVVGPGSTHATGTVYTVRDGSAPAPLPAVLADYLAPPAAAATSRGRAGNVLEFAPSQPGPAARAAGGSGRVSAWVTAAIRGALHDLEDVATLPEGVPDRHGRTWETGALHAAACRLAEVANAAGPDFTLADAGRAFTQAAPAGHEDRFAHHWADAVKTVDGRPATIPAPRTAAQPGTTGIPANSSSLTPGTSDDEAGPFDPDATFHGQLRMAHRLAAAYRDRLMHVYGIGWYAWDGTRWAEDTGQAQEAVYDVIAAALVESVGSEAGEQLRKDAVKCESAAGVEGVLKLAAPLPEVKATVDQLDADPYLLNCANGTLDLHTLTLRPHDPADRITKATRAAWRPDTEPGPWHEFLARILPDTAVRDYLQRFTGLALLGTVREHVFTIATGTGANGKSTMYEALLNAVGDYGHTAERDLFAVVKGNPNAANPALLGLRGRRFVVVSETENGAKVAPALMKALTGGDPINARPLYGRPVTFEPSHTTLMVTNHLPKLPADDDAVWRRVRVVPFDVTIPPAEQDPALGEALELAADEVLAWALAGWADYQTDGLAEPAAVKARTAAYAAEQDDVARFIDACCVTGPGVGETTTNLHDAYKAWCASEGVDVTQSRRRFGESLDRLKYPALKGGKGRRIRQGVGLAADGEQQEMDVTSANATGVADVAERTPTSSRGRVGEVSTPYATSATPPVSENNLNDLPEACPACNLPTCDGTCEANS